MRITYVEEHTFAHDILVVYIYIEIKGAYHNSVRMNSFLRSTENTKLLPTFKISNMKLKLKKEKKNALNRNADSSMIFVV